MNAGREDRASIACDDRPRAPVRAARVRIPAPAEPRAARPLPSAGTFGQRRAGPPEGPSGLPRPV